MKWRERGRDLEKESEREWERPIDKDMGIARILFIRIVLIYYILCVCFHDDAPLDTSFGWGFITARAQWRCLMVITVQSRNIVQNYSSSTNKYHDDEWMAKNLAKSKYKSSDAGTAIDAD